MVSIRCVVARVGGELRLLGGSGVVVWLWDEVCEWEWEWERQWLHHGNEGRRREDIHIRPAHKHRSQQLRPRLKLSEWLNGWLSDKRRSGRRSGLRRCSSRCRISDGGGSGDSRSWLCCFNFLDVGLVAVLAFELMGVVVGGVCWLLFTLAVCECCFDGVDGVDMLIADVAVVLRHASDRLGQAAARERVNYWKMQQRMWYSSNGRGISS